VPTDGSIRDHSEEPFELIRELGRGGFATTYRARVLRSDLLEDYGSGDVAVKIPLNRQKERALRRELELNAGLHLRLKASPSANLVRYLGFEVFRGQIVMVMEYADQGSLRGLIGSIGRQRKLPIERAVGLAQGVLHGIAVIHREHIFHRDIKPENILLHDDVPKIADLGIGRLLESEQVASTQVGTLPYMSPELLGAEGASFTSDLWSLAVTLYEMVTGRLPFGDEHTPIRPLIEMICRATPMPACQVSKEVPPELSDVIARALSRDPAERYPSADAMADALSRLDLGGGRSDVEKELAAIRSMMGTVAGAGEAERRLQALIAGRPRHPRLLQCLGELHARCQRYKEAIHAFERAVALAPDNGVVHFNLALAYHGDRQMANALSSLERALALPLDQNIRQSAARLRLALKGGGA
jgi:serine/threonine-protein kinase